MGVAHDFDPGNWRQGLAPVIGRYDPELTAQYRKDYGWTSSESSVYLRKDGSHRIVLAGLDKSRLRNDCFARDHWQCVDRGNGLNCKGRLELSHWPPMSKPEGSDQLDQVFCRCQKHHRLKDLHGEDGHF